MNVETRTKLRLIADAIFHCNYGKRTWAKETALSLSWCLTQDEYRENAKQTLLSLADRPEKLLEVAKALRWLKRWKRNKCPRAGNLIVAYHVCDSFPPTFAKLRETFIAYFGEKKWSGDWSARNTLINLGLPLKEMRKGRPIGSVRRR
jgi:hypothetical protein